MEAHHESAEIWVEEILDHPRQSSSICLYGLSNDPNLDVDQLGWPISVVEDGAELSEAADVGHCYRWSIEEVEDLQQK